MKLKRFESDDINESRIYFTSYKKEAITENIETINEGIEIIRDVEISDEDKKNNIIERLSCHWRDKLNNELIIPKSLYKYTLEELETLEKYYINESNIWDTPGKNLPKIFTFTKYKLPTPEDLIDINNYNLSADDIIQGFGYTIIGKGIRTSENINNIVNSIKMLCEAYPDNEIYNEALNKVKNKYNINENIENTQPIVKQLGIIDYYKRLLSLLDNDKYTKITKNKKNFEKRIDDLFHSYHIYSGSYNDITDKESIIELMNKINKIIEQYDIDENNLNPFNIDKINFDRFNLKENIEISENLLETLKELKNLHMSNEAVEDIRIENDIIVFDVKCETEIQSTSEYNGIKLSFNKLCGLKNMNENVSFVDEMTEDEIIEQARMIKESYISEYLSDIYDDTINEQAKLNIMQCFKDFFKDVNK